MRLILTSLLSLALLVCPALCATACCDGPAEAEGAPDGCPEVPGHHADCADDTCICGGAVLPDDGLDLADGLGIDLGSTIDGLIATPDGPAARRDASPPPPSRADARTARAFLQVFRC